MPELPEVENVARALRDNLTGVRLTGLQVSFAGILGQSVRKTRSALVGKVLTDVHRHGKYMILWFEGDDGAMEYLMVHLRMTGQFFILDDFVPDKHVHLIFEFDGLTFTTATYGSSAAWTWWKTVWRPPRWPTSDRI